MLHVTYQTIKFLNFLTFPIYFHLYDKFLKHSEYRICNINIYILKIA